MRIRSYVQQVQEIEEQIKSNQYAILEDNALDKLQFTFQSVPRQTHKYKLFLHPEALPFIKIKDSIELRQFNNYRIKFVYDLNADWGEIEYKELALTRFESSLWACKKHRFERVLPPLHPDYQLRCGVCGEKMKEILPAPFPELRLSIEALPEYRRVLNDRRIKTETSTVMDNPQLL